MQQHYLRVHNKQPKGHMWLVLATIAALVIHVVGEIQKLKCTCTLCRTGGKTTGQTAETVWLLGLCSKTPFSGNFTPSLHQRLYSGTMLRTVPISEYLKCGPSFAICFYLVLVYYNTLDN